MKVYKEINDGKRKYKLVVPENEKEKKDLEQLIEDSKAEVDIDPGEFESFKIGDPSLQSVD
ncbi:MAG TPA: hypothetical protein ENI73_09185 [Spirochaetes bacterium]|nr:hypothetical protein [Spirochaetota bacterium]